MNYKNKKTNQVINSTCYNRLNYSEQRNWEECYNEPTHSYDHQNSSDDNFLFNALTTIAVDEVVSSVFGGSFGPSTVDMPESSSFGGFSGGDTSGGGAGGDW